MKTAKRLYITASERERYLANPDHRQHSRFGDQAFVCWMAVVALLLAVQIYNLWRVH